MKHLSEKSKDKVREVEGEILKRLQLEGQKPLYELLNIDRYVFSRFFGNKNGIGIAQVIEILALLDLKVVDRNQIVCPLDSLPVPKKEIMRAFAGVTESMSSDSLQYKFWLERLEDYGLVTKNEAGESMIPLEYLK